MLGIQAPRFAPGPTLPPSPPRTFDRPSSRERLGLRSLNRPPRSPGLSWTKHAEETVQTRDMTTAYPSAHQRASQHASGTYGSAMNGISNHKAAAHPATWSNFQPNTSCQNAQASLPASQAQSRAASPEFETQPSYGSDSYMHSKKNSNNAIHPYLQLPPTISSSGGSISEFAAQVCDLLGRSLIFMLMSF